MVVRGGLPFGHVTLDELVTVVAVSGIAETKEGTVANKATKNEWTNMTVQCRRKE